MLNKSNPNRLLIASIFVRQSFCILINGEIIKVLPSFVKSVISDAVFISFVDMSYFNFSIQNAAHQLWYVIVSTLAASGQYSPLFNSLIEAFCIEKLKYDISTKEIKTASDMTDFTNDGKTLIISPYIRVQNDCLKNMLDISKRFGLDLLSMEAIGINEEKDKDPLNDEL